MNEWITSWEIWAILGLLCFIAEILDGTGTAIAFGVAALIMSGLAVVAKFAGLQLIPNWKIAAVEYAIFAISSVFIVRRLRTARGDDSDINRY